MKSPLASVTIWGLVMSLFPLVTQAASWKTMDADQRSAFLTAAFAWLTTAYGRIRQGNLSFTSAPKVAALFLLFPLLGACALVPKQENLDAVRTTATQLTDLSAKSEKIYVTAIDGFAKKLRQKSHESDDNYVSYLRVKMQLETKLPLTGEQEALFQKQQDELDAVGDQAIDELVLATKDHNVHVQMHDLSDWLNRWLFVHLSSEEQNAVLVQQGHDLLFKPKAVQ